MIRKDGKSIAIILIGKVPFQFYVWNCKDVEMLKQWRIYGQTFLEDGRQDVDFSKTPVILTKEAARCAVELGVASLFVKDTAEPSGLDETDIRTYLRGYQDHSSLIEECNPTKKARRLMKRFEAVPSNSFIRIVFEEGASDKISSFKSEIQYKGARIRFPFPPFDDDVEKMKFLVYRDLYSKGLTLTNGSKFGGNFLVYHGFPETVHASSIVIVTPFNSLIPTSSIISWGRLATAVQKNVIIGLVSLEEEGLVKYVSFQWKSLIPKM